MTEWRAAGKGDLRTSTGQPTQWFNSAGEEVFFVLMVKVGGDDQPRRVIGMGSSKAAAFKDLDEAIARASHVRTHAQR